MSENKGYIAITYFITRASFMGFSSMCIINTLKQDAWLGIILGTILGIIPLILIYNVASFNTDESIIDIISKLFPNYGKYLKIIIGIFIYLFSILNFWNLNNLITSQYLNRTPTIIISLIFIIPVIMLTKKNTQIISRVSFILFLISIFFYIVSFIGLANKIEINNLFPILEYNPIKGIYYYLSYNVLPLYIILYFPGKYIKKNIIKGYIISSLSLIISMLVLISVLGINLVILFQYPEFHILKLVFDGFITFRLENILALQWIIDIFILITISLKYSNKSLNIKNYYILPIIMVILCNYLMPNNVIIIDLITYHFPTIICIFILTILLIIFIKQKKEILFPKI